MTKAHILASKLSIPMHPDLFIPPRLSGILKNLTEKRLTVLTAGAGHGKTALTAWAVRQKEIRPVWYHLDEQDRDFSRFIRYAAAGLKSCTQNLCPMMGQHMAPAPFSAIHRGRVLSEIVHALEAAPGSRVCLVLDDFHTVQKEKAILESVKFLVENLPPWFHIILLTRFTPEMGLSRLHLTGQAVEITESDLLFTLDETRRFLTKHVTPALPLKLADQVHRISNGWVAGLVLLYQSNIYYTQWCIEKRQRLQDIYLSVLWKLICHFLDKSQPDKGISFAQKYLETDNSVETVYQKLMQLYAVAGNRSLVKKTYEACRKNVFDALDCSPDPETIRLFHNCLAVK